MAGDAERAARIAKARAARESREAAAVVEPSSKSFIGFAQARGMEHASRWWSKFQQHLKESNAYDDVPKIDTAKGPMPELTHGIVTQFLAFYAANCAPTKHDVPSIWSARGRFNDLLKWMEIEGGIKLERETIMSYAHAALKNLVNAGSLASQPSEASLVAPIAFEALVKAALDLRWVSHLTAQRWEFCFVNAVELSTGCRMAAHFPPTSNASAKGSRYGHMSHKCFSIHVERGLDGFNVVSLTYRPARHKTRGTHRQEHSLLPSPQLYRCPVLWYLLLATLDGALPHSVEQLYHPDILGGEQSRNFRCVDACEDIPVCKGFPTKAKPISSWTPETMIRLLGKASHLARLTSSVKIHDYRRMAAVMLLGSGHEVQDVAYTLGHALTGVTRSYVQAFLTLSGGAAVFKTQDETREMLKKHPRVVVPVPLTSLPVLPPISAIRRATDEDSVVQAKLHATTLAKSLTQAASPNAVSDDDKARIDTAWSRYATRLAKWTRYYDDCDLYEQSVAARSLESKDGISGPPMVQSLTENPGMEDHELAEDSDDEEEPVGPETEPELEHEPDASDDARDRIRNLLEVMSDGATYQYRADTLEAVLLNNPLDSVVGTANFMCNNGDDQSAEELLADLRDILAPNLDPSLIDPQLRDEPCHPVQVNCPSQAQPKQTKDKSRSRGRGKGREPSSEDETQVSEADTDEDGPERGDSNEAEEEDERAISTMTDMSALLFGQEALADVPTRLQLIRLAASLPTRTREWRGYRPGHIPIDGVCPAHECPLSECIVSTGITRYERAHVHSAMELAARVNYRHKLLAKGYPTRTPEPVYWPTNRDNSRASSLVTDQYQNILSLYNAHRPVICRYCGDPIYGIGAAVSHFLVQHDVYLVRPPRRSTAATRADQAEGGWTEQDMIPRFVYWNEEELRYIVDPAELEVFLSDLFDRDIVGPSEFTEAYGIRDDVNVPDDILPDSPRNAPSDAKYRSEGTMQGASGHGRCFICVHDDEKEWALRMKRYLPGPLRAHSNGCLRRLVNRVRAWYAAEPPTPRKNANGKLRKWDVSNAKDHVLTTPLCVIGGLMSCPDPVCRYNGRITFTSMLPFIQHLVLVHHFEPFVRPHGRKGTIHPLNAVVPLNEADLDTIATFDGTEFVPEGLRTTDQFGRPLEEERVKKRQRWEDNKKYLDKSDKDDNGSQS